MPAIKAVQSDCETVCDSQPISAIHLLVNNPLVSIAMHVKWFFTNPSIIPLANNTKTADMLHNK